MSSKEKVGKLREQSRLKVVLLRVGLTFKTSLSSRRCFPNQVPSNLSKTRNERVSNPKPQKGINVDPPKERPTCSKCCKKHVGEYVIATNSCYRCGKSDHMVKDCPNVRNQGKGNSQVQPSGPNSEAPK